MKNIKVDRDSFYTMMSDLFNFVYGEGFALKNKEEIGFTRQKEFYTGKYEEVSLVTKENKKILANLQIAQGCKYNEIINNKEGTKFDTSVITLEEIKEMVEKEVLEHNFLTKIPSVIASLNTPANIKDDKIFISEELSLAICISFKKYINKEKRAESFLETDIYEMTSCSIEDYLEENNEKLLPCQKFKGRRLF